MTYGELLIRFERELNDQLHAYNEIETLLSADVSLLTTLQLRELLYSKMAVETAERKYYSFKLFIYRNNLDFEQDVSEFLVTEYDRKYEVTSHNLS